MFTFLRAIAWFRRDDSPKAEALRALALGRSEEAEAALGTLIETEASPAERAFFSNKRGVARVRLGKRDEALADFAAALDDVPNYPPALTNVGNLLLEDGSIDDAIAHYEAAIRADERYAPAHQNLGVAYRRSGKIGSAVRSLRKAQRLENQFFRKR